MGITWVPILKYGETVIAVPAPFHIVIVMLLSALAWRWVITWK